MNGVEWIVEAHGCEADALRDIGRLQTLFSEIIAGLQLHPVGETLWHQFPVTGGITGMCLLAESHLTCHTFPEYGSLCLNLFCCRPRAEWDFHQPLKKFMQAQHISVRRVERPYSSTEYRAPSPGEGDFDSRAASAAKSELRFAARSSS